MTQDFQSTEPLPFETPETRGAIFERFEGAQISRIEHHPTETNPLGGAMFGLETTKGNRLIVMAVPDLTDGSPSPWCLRPTLLLDEHIIWTKTVTKHFTRGRALAGEPAPGWLQERVEGEVIEVMRLLPEVTPWGGEQLLTLFRGGDALLCRARPAHGIFTCNFSLHWVSKTKPDQPLIALPGGQTV